MKPSWGMDLVDNRHFHVPASSRPICPVCKKAAYSRGGIHPQCAMIQSEPPRPKKQASRRSEGAIIPEPTWAGGSNELTPGKDRPTKLRSLRGGEVLIPWCLEARPRRGMSGPRSQRPSPEGDGLSRKVRARAEQAQPLRGLRWSGQDTMGCAASPMPLSSVVKRSEGLSRCVGHDKPFQLCRGKLDPRGADGSASKGVSLTGPLRGYPGSRAKYWEVLDNVQVASTEGLRGKSTQLFLGILLTANYPDLPG